MCRVGFLLVALSVAAQAQDDAKATARKVKAIREEDEELSRRRGS